MKRTLENMTIEFLTDNNGKEKVYKGYTNKEFYHYGYVPYFEKETALQIMDDFNDFQRVENYDAKIFYDIKNDCFTFEDKENGDGMEIWKSETIQTEHGTKKLYPIGIEWQWDILESK